MVLIGTEYKIIVGDSIDNPILTEDIIKVLTCLGFEGGTIISSVGLWKGKTEQSYIILVSEPDRSKITRLVNVLKIRFGQETIYIGYNGEGYIE